MLNGNYIVKTEETTIATQSLDIRNDYCWIDELKTLFRILNSGDTDVQPDAIVNENDVEVYRLCQYGTFESADKAFYVLDYNVKRLNETLSYLDLDSETHEIVSDNDTPKTYVACYLFNYFGGDVLDGKVIDGASIDVAFRPFKDDKLVQFLSEEETCVKFVVPSNLLPEGREETIYFSNLVHVSYDMDNCYKLSLDEALVRKMCMHFGWNRIKISVEHLSLSYQENEYVSDIYDCDVSTFVTFLKSHPDGFDIEDNINAQCPAYYWIDK